MTTIPTVTAQRFSTRLHKAATALGVFAPVLTDDLRVNVEVSLDSDEPEEVSVHGLTAKQMTYLRRHYEIADRSDDEYGNPRWMTVTVNGVQVTFFPAR